MRRAGLFQRTVQRAVAALTAVMLVLAACTGEDSERRGASPTPAAAGAPDALPGPSPTPAPSATPTPAPTATPAAPAGMHALDVRTGIAAVDTVIEAVAARDRAALRALVKLTEIPCTTQRTGIPGLPPCPDRALDGAPVLAFPRSTCTPHFVLSLEAAQDTANWLVERPLLLYAVHHTNRPPAPGAPPAPYALTFGASVEDYSARTIYLDEAGGIVMAQMGCGVPPDRIRWEATRFVLSPAAAASAAPSPAASPSAGASAPQARGVLTLEPDRGDCGRSITVRSEQFPPGATIALSGIFAFPDPPGSQITIPSDGAFAVRAIVHRPSGCREGEQFRLTAEDTRIPRTNEDLAVIRAPTPEAVYTVITPTPPPTFTLSADTGPCDASIEVAGARLAPQVNRVALGMLGPLGSDSPSVLLGAADVDDGGRFHMRITLGADGCDLARGHPDSRLERLLPLPFFLYDATDAPFLLLGTRARYTPTTGEPGPEGSRHRNPRWTDRTCCD